VGNIDVEQEISFDYEEAMIENGYLKLVNKGIALAKIQGSVYMVSEQELQSELKVTVEDIKGSATKTSPVSQIIGFTVTNNSLYSAEFKYSDFNIFNTKLVPFENEKSSCIKISNLNDITTLEPNESCEIWLNVKNENWNQKYSLPYTIFGKQGKAEYTVEIKYK